MNTIQINCLGYSIVSDWHEGRTTNEIILFLMGYTTTRERQRTLVEAIVQKTGMSALSIDYSGHGDSPFDLADISPAQHMLEVVASYDWIIQRHPNAKVSIVSGSYGAFLAAYLIEYRPIEKLVLRTPAIYKPEEFYDTWGERLKDEAKFQDLNRSYRANPAALKAHPIFENGRRFKGRTLVVVHDEDEAIPTQVTDVYRDAFKADEYIAKGFKHSISKSNADGAQMAAYQDVLSSWLSDDR
jgi:esterase/lipase